MQYLKISCVNLSCGYYLPHTPHEFTCAEDLQKCYRFVRHIVGNCNKTYRHDIRKTERYGYGWMTDPFSEYHDIQNRMRVPYHPCGSG